MEEAGVLMALPDAGCGGGEAGLLMARRWLWGGRLGFSWQSQMLVVRGRGEGSHGNFTRWLCGVEADVLMAVPDAGFGGRG